MPKTTPAQRAELQRLSDDATMGWTAGLNLEVPSLCDPDESHIWVGSLYLGQFDSSWMSEITRNKNAKLTVAARNALPDLLSDIAELEDALRCALGQDKSRESDIENAIERCQHMVRIGDLEAENARLKDRIAEQSWERR